MYKTQQRNYDDELEDIPSEFDQEMPFHSNCHSTVKFNSNLPHNNTHTPKKNIAQFINKSQQFLVNKQHKIQQLKSECESRVLVDCTFKPQINRSKNKSVRNLKQFLDCQSKHQVKVQEKNTALKNTIQHQNLKQMTFSPKINSKKHDRNKQNVHERLYKLKDKEKQSTQVLYNHIPKITERGERLVRNIPIDELLYLDAMRRAQKHVDVPEIEDQHNERNVNKQKYAAQKFLKQFKTALLALNLFQQKEYNQFEFESIMLQLGFAKHHSDSNNVLAQQQRRLITEAYNYLLHHSPTQINLYVFLLAVVGIYNIDLNSLQMTDIIVIQDESGKKLHQYFDTLFRNRLFSHYSKRINKTPPKDQNTYKPIINPDSSDMAERYRNKMIERANNIFLKNDINIQIPDKGISHGDLLVIYNLGQNLQKQKLRQNKMLWKDPQCTFQPNSQKYQEQPNQNIASDKCRQLYQQAKNKQLQMSKLGTSFDQKSFTKRSQISPRATPTKLPKQTVNSYLQVKDVDKTLARMVMGRQLRNQKREYEERGQGIPNKKGSVTKHNLNLQHKCNEDDIILDVDVSVNGVSRKIFIYRQDEKRLPEVVSEFAHKYSLDQVSYDQLLSKLTKAMHNLR